MDFYTVLTKGDCMSIFTTALFIIDKSGENLKYSSTFGKMEKLRYIPMIEYYTVVKGINKLYL